MKKFLVEEKKLKKLISIVAIFILIIDASRKNLIMYYLYASTIQSAFRKAVIMLKSS